MGKREAREDYDLVDAMQEGTEGGPVESTESGLQLTLGMGAAAEYEEAAPIEVRPEELEALALVDAELNARAPETQQIHQRLDAFQARSDLGCGRAGVELGVDKR